MKKLLALLMAGIMLLSFAACGGNGEEETTTEPEITTAAPVDADVEEETEAEEVTEAEEETEAEEATEAEEETEAAEEETEAEKATEKEEKPSKENKPAKEESKKPSTTKEIVEYFNKAVDGVKTGAKSVKQHSIVNYLAEPTKIGDGLKGIYNMLGGDSWLDDTLQANSTGEATYTGADIKKNYPVENESWASKLTADDVKSATCTEANGIYTIKIVTKADAKTSTVKHGQGHNPKVFSVVLPATINENIPGIAKGITGDVTMNYPSGSATITVDAETGRVLTATYDAHWTINFDKMATSLPFATKFTYTINW